jgi:hypothetical protein
MADEHREELPMVKAATHTDEAGRIQLFVPCPLTPRNLPLKDERKA